MNFRLPFQISRVSAICQSSSPLNFLSKFSSINGSHVKNTKLGRQSYTPHSRTIITICSNTKFYSPFNFFQKKAFLHNLAETEEAVRQRVRYEQGCHLRCEETPELAFRQTSKVECCKCMDIKPNKAPPLKKPPKFYDDSQCQYKHKCTESCEVKPPRMDDYCCCQYVKRGLPCVPIDQNTYPCIDVIKKPCLAPPLCPPTKWYDPEILKWEHKECPEPKPLRMDDVCLQVLPRELPTVCIDECEPCMTFQPLTAPPLKPPPIRYDATCMLYPHPNCPNPEDDAERRDDCLDEPVIKELPEMPCGHYIPCHQQPTPTHCPPLCRPRARYDSTEMEYKHEYPTNPCDEPLLRRDNNIISVTVKKKKLPRIREDLVDPPCYEYRTLTAPALNYPVAYNNNMYQEQCRAHCVEEKPIRRDGDIQIYRQCLPKVPISNCTYPCMDIFKPCTTPRFKKPEKLYDDSNCLYQHNCVPEECEETPIRLDDYCFRVCRKALPKLSDSPNCRPELKFPHKSPLLCPPTKWYDDSRHKYQHECPDDPCKTNPRADNVTGLKDEVKTLQPFKPLKGTPCQQFYPYRAPKLCRPHARYDDSCMLYRHCPTCYEQPCFRRDDYAYEPPKKELPKLEYGTICECLCQDPYPCNAPPLNCPKKRYEFLVDPIRVKAIPPECPPRRDDIFCWRPRRKKLPSFKDCCGRKCSFSTFTWVSSKKTPILHIVADKIIAPTSKIELKELKELKEEPKIKEPIKKLKSILKKCPKQYPIRCEDPYIVVDKPTFKCIDSTSNEKSPRKLYDYSIEKWFKKGAEFLMNGPNSNKKENNDQICNQIDGCKFSGDGKSITPLKFTGFDKTDSEQFLYIKKNNKIQKLKLGSAFKSVTSSKAETCLPESFKDASKEPEEKKLTSSPAPITKKEDNKNFMLTSIIQEHIKTYNTNKHNFVLNLNNTMRSTIFQKISNFFKKREKAAKKKALLQEKPNVSASKTFIDNIREKYNVDSESTPTEATPGRLERNKAYLVKKFKEKGLKLEKERLVLSCSSKTATNLKSGPSKPLLKQCKIKKEQVRNFSTCKDGRLYYKHIDISDDYIGKIYKVKLKKIGVKNLMLEKNDPDKRDEEPHTICYICKVVPRYQPIVHDEPPDIENVKINYYREKRNTIE